MPDSEPFVVALIATYRRPKELAALVDLLGRVRGLGALIVADNAAEAATAEIVRNAGVEHRYLAVPGNPGVGVALNRAMHLADEEWGAKVTHFWVMDDDVLFPEETLTELLDAMARNDAAIAAPTTLAPNGAVFDWPKLKSPLAHWRFRSLKRAGAGAFAAIDRNAPLPIFNSCVGVCWLFESRCRKQLGDMREDFFMYAEDAEYSARLAAHYRAIYCPHVQIFHLWCAPAGSTYRYVKLCIILQNNVYMVSRLAHTRHFLLPFLGSVRRFLPFLKAREAVYDLLWILWYGGVRGQPAGTTSGQELRQRRANYCPAD